MNKNTPTALCRPAGLLILGALLFSGCQKSNEPTSNNSTPDEVLAQKSGNEKKKVGHFSQTNLVANDASYHASRIDPTLLNAWGIAFAPPGIAWVNAQA